MNLGWGGGTFDVLLDLRSRQLIAYSSETAAAKVHQIYGGKNYYCSCSGMSGAGWIPSHMTLRSIATYRVDSAYIEAPDLASVQETLPGLAIIAPINYRGGNIPHKWPIAVIKGFRKPYYENNSSYDQLYLLDKYGLSEFLVGEEGQFEDIEVSVRYVPSVWEGATERTFPVRVPKGTCLNYRRALVGLFNRELAFKAGEGEQMKTNRFWARLGIWQIGDRFFKIAQNVCRARYTREELSTVEGLQVASPQNVFVLTPNLYIQESDAFEAVALFNIDGEEVEFEERLEVFEAVKAMAGNFAEVLARLETGARNKLEKVREARRQQEQWAAEQAERDAKFRELCEEYAELEITLEDSLAAGNCRPGTEDFRNKHFPQRESVKVGELVRFLSVYGVRRVLEYKLLPLVEKATA
jgi:hypothetical protein